MITQYLEFKPARCKDCYKCLRGCPVKAIEVKNHQAQIIPERCILCGNCTIVCPQNAKIVHSELDEARIILAQEAPVIASVAPSFVSSFGIQDFSIFRRALRRLGFDDAQETSVGAGAVTKEYARLLRTGDYPNFITSSCPALCRLIQEYHPKALKYLAPVDSPMVAHAKILKKYYPQARIIFIGPCIAKKREARESALIDSVLTFEDLLELFREKGIVLQDMEREGDREPRDGYANLAKSYPIPQGIIKSFSSLPEGYEYMAVDGAGRCLHVLENIESFSGAFLEMNICRDACINGPCSLTCKGDSIKAIMDLRKYVNRDVSALPREPEDFSYGVDLSAEYPRIVTPGPEVTDSEIEEVLHRIGKFTPEDELNCGACGYPTCRDKAWAVIKGYADWDICLPYMREKAETMSYEIIHNSPEGIIVLDNDFKVIDINDKAKELLDIHAASLKGLPAVDFFNPSDFLAAQTEKRHIERKKLYIRQTGKYVDLSIDLLSKDQAIFAIMKDVTASVDYDYSLSQMRLETLSTTDEVIKKQMRVAQEIASLLGETTAETKVALLKLKKTLQEKE